jgi:hypothetical protein
MEQGLKDQRIVRAGKRRRDGRQVLYLYNTIEMRIRPT